MAKPTMPRLTSPLLPCHLCSISDLVNPAGNIWEGAMRQWLRYAFDRDRSNVQRINAMRTEVARLDDRELRATASKTKELLQWIASSDSSDRSTACRCR